MAASGQGRGTWGSSGACSRTENDRGDLASVLGEGSARAVPPPGDPGALGCVQAELSSGPSVTARGPGARLCCEELLGGVCGEVAGHAAVDDIGQVAFEDAAGLLLGVWSVGAGVGVDRLGAWLAAQLRDRHAVQDGVDPAVAAGVVAVADRFAGPFAGGGGQRCGAVEACEPALGEPAHIADLDQQFGDRPGIQATELREGRAALAHELAEVGDDLLLLAIQRGDLRAVLVEHPQPRRGRRALGAGGMPQQSGRGRAANLQKGTAARIVLLWCIFHFSLLCYRPWGSRFQYSSAGPLRPPGPAVTAMFRSSSISSARSGLKRCANRTSSSSLTVVALTL